MRLRPTHVAMDWRAVRERRRAAGLTLAEMGRRCGWSPQYQHRIERGVYPSIPMASYRAIRAAAQSVR